MILKEDDNESDEKEHINFDKDGNDDKEDDADDDSGGGEMIMIAKTND